MGNTRLQTNVILMQRQNISSGAPWEPKIGYSRAVRIGNLIEVSGTVAIREGKTVGIGNPYKQTIRIFEIIDGALQKAGGSMQDVIRTRMYVTDITSWPEVGRAHGEVFKGINPATSLVEISGLIDPEHLVEVEVTAIIQ